MVLGVGNLLLGDDGVGPAVVDALRQAVGTGTGEPIAAGPGGRRLPGAGVPAPGPALPPGTVLVDGGTRGLALLPEITGARAVVLVDAVDLGPHHPPGTVHVLQGPALGDVYRPRATAHQVGVSDLIAVARFCRRLPGRLALVGLQPADTRTRVGLSPAVAVAVPAAVEETRRRCWSLHRAGAASA